MNEKLFWNFLPTFCIILNSQQIKSRKLTLQKLTKNQRSLFRLFLLTLIIYAFNYAFICQPHRKPNYRFGRAPLFYQRESIHFQFHSNYMYDEYVTSPETLDGQSFTLFILFDCGLKNTVQLWFNLISESGWVNSFQSVVCPGLNIYSVNLFFKHNILQSYQHIKTRESSKD